MNSKKLKAPIKGSLKKLKSRKHGLASHSERRGCHARLEEMDTSNAIWEAHDDPC